MYTSVFSHLARDFSAWIVAGSILLPKVNFVDKEEALREDGLDSLIGKDDDSVSRSRRLDVSLSSEGLFNVSLSFAPDGSVCNVTHKCYLDRKGM